MVDICFQYKKTGKYSTQLKTKPLCIVYKKWKPIETYVYF